MDESLQCDCGGRKFWFFGNYVRCITCYTEFAPLDAKDKPPVRVIKRTFNKDSKTYSDWEIWDYKI